MKKYTLLNNGTYKNNETQACNITPSNWMFREVQEWLDAGNVPDAEFTSDDLNDQAWSALRTKRDAMLAATDFMMTVDYYNSMPDDHRKSITAYRKALRDLPDLIDDINSVVWPAKPDCI